MQPQQPYYGPGPSYGPALPSPEQGGQYDFIMSGKAPQPKQGFLGDQTPFVRRVIYAAAGLLVLMIALALFNILSQANKTNVAPFVTVAQEQAEISRVSVQAILHASAPITLNFAMTTQLTMLTDQQDLIKYLQKQGTKPSDKELAAKKDSKADTALKTAQTNGTYDQLYLSIVGSDITAYQQALRTASATAKTTSEQQLLKIANDHLKILQQLYQQVSTPS